MDTLIYIMSGACLVLLFAVLIVVISKKNKTRDVGAALAQFQATFYRQLEEINKQNAASASQLRQEVLGMFNILGENFTKTLSGTARANREDMENLRSAVEHKLKEISDTNERRLEQIRKTVDDQLQDMLQKRLTGSFKQVSDQLEQVFKSMGEVKSLATGVGDLKRVLSNVKVRGTWGEMQLGNLISAMLSPVQYIKNANVKDNQERVEYAVVLPGSADNKVLLPIDSKFPMEDFIKKEEILNSGDKQMAKDAMKSLAKSIVTEAQRIHSKYINPPVTTDFAIMYLPTEGLYADAITLGIFDICQREYHVTISGPSTLTALLNSLQMGFRTLAIEKQSGEVLRLLDSTRKAFSNFTSAIDKTQKSLAAAQNNLEDASRKSRTIERQLDKVDSFEKDRIPIDE
ncbi:MAG: DNA recombination protein RmuC [Eubacteriales bacterium]|nr:DNA recombination protein RmuC [Eubacteriales bacterium]